ncbi:12215_t:CDS:2, partial [Ambispora leptoticha]
MEETLKMGARVLDGGCGPGTWLLDMATHYPNSQFFGVDIIPVYPSQIKPANVNFYQCDLIHLEQLGFEQNSFDMVRLAHMQFVTSESDFVKIIEEMLKLLKPGGYIEFVEGGLGVSNSGPNITRILQT